MNLTPDLEIVYLDPHDLTPYEGNARKHGDVDVQGIKDSIETDGFNDPIGIWGDNNLIVEGHGRQLAAIALGMEKVPCIRLDHLTDAQRRDYAIRHNRTAELSEWDEAKKQIELEALAMEGFDVGDLFEPQGEQEQAEIKEDEAQKPPEEPKAKRGHIYQLGRHRLMCGDATDAGDVAKLMNGATADIAITSPPYGESASAKLRDHYERGKAKRETLYNEHDDKKDGWRDLIEKALASMQSASIAQFVNVQMLADNKRDLVRIIGNHVDELCDIIVWDKQKAAPQMQSNVLNNEFEFIFVFAKSGSTRSIPFADFHGNRSNMIRLGVGVNEYAEIHRAVFPVGLPSAILNIAQKSVSVLDVFGGTGTTLMACEQTNRVCYMMEIDPKYIDVIIERWETFTGETAVLIDG